MYFFLKSSAGIPKYDLWPANDLLTPLFAEITAFSPMVIPLVIPACPQMVTKSSMITQPEIPTCEAIKQRLPITVS